MKLITALALMTLLVWVGGCVESVHPFYTDDQNAFDDSLVGTWTDGKEIVILSAAADKKLYNVTYIDEDMKTGHFLVHLAQVQDHLLADIAPDELKTQDSDSYKGLLMPMHLFMWVEKRPDTLLVTMMKYEWLRDYLKGHQDAIKHEVVGGNTIILTAQPAELQKFIVAQLKTDAYGEPTEFHRTKPPATMPSGL